MVSPVQNVPPYRKSWTRLRWRNRQISVLGKPQPCVDWQVVLHSREPQGRGEQYEGLSEGIGYGCRLPAAQVPMRCGSDRAAMALSVHTAGVKFTRPATPTSRLFIGCPLCRSWWGAAAATIHPPPPLSCR